MIAPWLIPPNFLGAAEAGTQAGLALSRAGTENAQTAQRFNLENRSENDRQSDAATRLQQSYDSLAQQHDLSQQEIAARSAQAQAAQALRQHANDSLQMWRQSQAQNQQRQAVLNQQKVADSESKAGDVLKTKQAVAEQTAKFYKGLSAGEKPSDLLKENPLASTDLTVRELIREQFKKDQLSGQPKFGPTEAETTIGDTKVKYDPRNSAALSLLGTNAPAFGTMNPPPAPTNAPAAMDTLRVTPAQLKSINQPQFTKISDVRDAYNLPEDDPNKLSKEDALEIINKRFKDQIPSDTTQ